MRGICPGTLLQVEILFHQQHGESSTDNFKTEDFKGSHCPLGSDTLTVNLEVERVVAPLTTTVKRIPWFCDDKNG